MDFVKRKTIKVKPPINLLPSEKNVFHPGEFDTFQTQTLYLKDVVVTTDGLCFKQGKLIPESTQRYVDKVSIFTESGLLQLEKNPFFQLSGSDDYLLVHHPWNQNYYHWLTEAIPRIWQVKERLQSLTLVMPDYLLRLPFVKESLECFKFGGIVTVPGTHNIIVPNAIIPEMKPFCYSYNPEYVKEISAFFTNIALSRTTLPSEDIHYAYVIRGRSSRREIVNEDQVVQKLKEYNISAIDMPSKSFLEQVSLSSRLKLLISNGSGLTNMMFMGGNTSVMEMHKQLTNMNDFHDKVIWHLSSVLDQKYFHQFCNPVDNGKDMYKADLIIDIQILEKNIEKWISHM